jgi:hypothetical protein
VLVLDIQDHALTFEPFSSAVMPPAVAITGLIFRSAVIANSKLSGHACEGDMAAPHFVPEPGRKS